MGTTNHFKYKAQDLVENLKQIDLLDLSFALFSSGAFCWHKI